MNAQRLTLTWALLVDGESGPIFGTERDSSLEKCHTRIWGIWETYGLGMDGKKPLVWMFKICDEHGRTFSEDWLVNGSDDPRIAPLQMLKNN